MLLSVLLKVSFVVKYKILNCRIFGPTLDSRDIGKDFKRLYRS